MNSRLDELKKKEKEIKKAQWAANKRLDATRVMECERALLKIWEEMDKIS